MQARNLLETMSRMDNSNSGITSDSLCNVSSSSRLVVLGCAVTIAAMIIGTRKLLKDYRLGERRSSKPIVIQDDGDVLIEERETGLIQQWYTDQPCQRLYGLAYGATFSYEGIQRLHNREHIRRVILALIHRHPILSTTVVRESNENGRAKLRRTVMKSIDFNNNGTPSRHPLGPMPVTWHIRENEGTWRDIAHKITHTDIDESSWLFRIAIIVPPLGENGTGSRSGYRAEIVIASNHIITDGLSTVTLIKDFITGLAAPTDTNIATASFSQLLPPLPLISMDDVIDMRPPLGLILSVVGEDLLPSWLRKVPSFWQGPLPNVTQPVEGHLATITVPPSLVKQLSAVAKKHHVTMHGLLSSLLLSMQAKLAINMDKSSDSAKGSVPLKFLFPMGRGTRQLGNIPLDQVGAFITGGEMMLNVHPTVVSTDNVHFWEMAKQITDSAKTGLREALDFLGLLNFLPRDSYTPWFIRDGSRYTHGRNSSLEVSNLGLTNDLDSLILNNDSVNQLFQVEALTETPPEICLVKGRGYRGPVLGIGMCTTQSNLTISICSQLGQCGCSSSYPIDAYTREIESTIQPNNNSGRRVKVVCACPKDKLLSRYCSLVEEALYAVCEKKQ